MSNNSIEKKNCKNKTRYSNDASAQEALKRINQNKTLGKPRRVYKCPVCNGWHLSSKAKH
ncbi:hypothetical protein KC947_01395 [Candidatus Saccharibacteria bacterium]|nr:hypothetical protein [Candidatus Saccharibacteria bacterium]